MDDFINWIMKNKEWLFSGGGITIITVVYLLVVKRRPPVDNNSYSRQELTLTKNDALWIEWMVPAIKTTKAKTAYLIEYSSSNVIQFIELLMEYGWTVKLLMKDPNSVDAQWQKDKINHNRFFLQRDMKEHIDNKKLEIFLYSCPGSIRLRYLEDLSVTLGWYTYDFREGFGPDQIFGHNNLTISITPNQKEWSYFKEFAMRTFEGMKKNAGN